MDLNKLFAYDHWANRRIIEAFQKLNDSEARSNVGQLFSHLLAAQVIWMSRITGEKTDLEIWPELSVQEMKALIDENNEKLIALISKKEEGITYHNSKGEAFENKVGDILTHLIIHGQHHRAQIAKLLREAGVKPPGTDYLFFIR
ncbi:DinB family protein [Gracilimonas sp.]|uniref:DinB family protein n=1 Tax=Gracilimonas sp. TaxID=1974203 RepID=UPI0032EE7DEF